MTNNKIIYLDNAASTKVDDYIAKAMHDFSLNCYSNPSSNHEFGKKSKETIESARYNIAKSLNCLPEEIIFTSGGTESNNLALLGMAESLKHKGNHIITSQIEHPSILETCKALEKKGYEITYVPVDKYGLISLDIIKNSIKPKTILISIMHANNEIGTTQPIEEITLFANKNNLLFHTDAVQSYKKINIDLKKIKIDLLTISSHKIHGPKGIGALFLRKGLQITPLIYGGGQENNIRSGTENVSAIKGFGEAAILDQDIKKISEKRDLLIKYLLNIKGTKLNGHPTKRLCNNVNISFEGIEAETLLEHLNNSGIMASIGSACHSHKLEPSHVLNAIGLSEELSLGTIRLTLSKYTTDREINYTIKKIDEIVTSLRKLVN